MPQPKIRPIRLAIVTALAIGAAVLYEIAPKPTPAPPPNTEDRLIAIVDHYRSIWKANTNDMRDAAIREHRADAICALLRAPIDGNFTGTIAHVGLASLPNMKRQIDAYIEVRLAPHLEFTTPVEDPLGNGTSMLAPGSKVYREVEGLQKGDAVAFAGVFTLSGKDCLPETSLTEDGSMTDPEFLFDFTEIKQVSSGQ